MQQLLSVSLTRLRAWPRVGTAVACLGLASLATACATPSLMPESQAAGIKRRDRALVSHAAEIQQAIRQSGKAGALVYLDANDHPVVLPGDTPSDAWAHRTTDTESATGRASIPAVLTFVHRADVPVAPDTITREALEQQQAARASRAAAEADLRAAHEKLEERLRTVQRELADAIAAEKKDTDASLAAVRAGTDRALRSLADDLESVRKFMLQTAQLGWLNQEMNAENAGGIKKLVAASQELSATSAKLQESMRQLSESIAGQLKELANRLDALQGKVTSLR